MRLLDRILGRNITLDTPPSTSSDEHAVERYEYLLRTARPDTIERSHVDAFERLTPQQRDLVFERFTAEVPADDRPADASSMTLAKAATRVEAREPGTLTRVLAGNRITSGDGRDEGGPLGGSLFATFATYAIASTAIDAIFWAGLIGTTDVTNHAGHAEDSGAHDAAAIGGGDTDFFSAFGL